MNSIEVTNLNFSYGKKPLLKNISFTARNGEFLGILGPNGCGKSTLLKNILGILEPDSGMIRILGKNLREISIKNLAKTIGFVPQKSALSVPLSVREVLLMGRFSHLNSAFSAYGARDLAEVENIAQKLNIAQFLNRSALSLSGGEFGRVMLARALLKNPRILLLDEPTSALDLNYALDLLALCKREFRALCVIVILHDLNLASLFCNRVIFLKNGEIRYDGEIRALFTREILREIYNLDCEIMWHENLPFIIPTLKEKL